MSNPVVYERTIASGEASGSVEKGVQLRAGCFARQFGDSAWTKIRVGIQYRMADVDQSGISSVYGRPRMCVGFCNGTTKIPGDITWDNWMAFATEPVSWATSTIFYQVYAGTTTERLNAYSGSAGYTIADLRNSIGDDNAGVIVYITSTTASADMMFVDVEQTSTDVYTMGIFYRNTPSTNIGDYPTTSEFETAVQSDTPTYSGYTQQATFTAMSSSHSSYPLNSVFVYWERSDIPMEIMKLYVVRLS